MEEYRPPFCLILLYQEYLKAPVWSLRVPRPFCWLQELLVALIGVVWQPFEPPETDVRQLRHRRRLPTSHILVFLPVTRIHTSPAGGTVFDRFLGLRCEVVSSTGRKTLLYSCETSPNILMSDTVFLSPNAASILKQLSHVNIFCRTFFAMSSFVCRVDGLQSIPFHGFSSPRLGGSMSVLAASFKLL